MKWMQNPSLERQLRLFCAVAVFVSFVPILTGTSRAEEFFVSSAGDITNALRSTSPGDVLIMTNGTWTDQHIELEADGITLRAETPGQVILNGTSNLEISGDSLTVDGLRFEGGALASGHVVRFRGDRGDATNSRLTNSAIIDYNPSDIDTRYFWVSMHGQNNRVDHNYFKNQNHSGVTVVVWRDNNSADNHRIDNNHFVDRPEGNGNGFETIRIGTSANSLSDSFTTVENNLFERVDGEIEIISSKSGSNTYQYNTFRESSGTLTLRHGNNNTVAGNFFLGEGRSGSGGVRVIGEDHTLVNNYFHDLDGRADGAISISAGVDGSAVNEYFQVKNATIAHNTIVDVNDAAIKLDHGFGSSSRTLLAENVSVVNNAIWSTQNTLIEGREGIGWSWEGNFAFGQSLGPKAGDDGFTVVDPQFSLAADGLYRPSATSPLLNAATGSELPITLDIDGQLRTGTFDVGADEFSTDAIVRVPLSGGDVGPNWIELEPTDPPEPPQPPTVGDVSPGCTVSGCAIQAEDFANLADPNNDGDTWTTQSNDDALGGSSLIAPTGNLLVIGLDAHDALAYYNLEFTQTGEYTAYYRARGFDGASNSLFTPTDFNQDPTNIETLVQNGQYDWEVGDSFFIGDSEVGVPLQFRIGKREGLADFDSFVLSLDDSLSDAELDALFLSPIGDCNEDGSVNAADLTCVSTIEERDHVLGALNTLVGDLDGNGDVGFVDFLALSANFGSEAGTYAEGNVDLSGGVGFTDFLALSANFGQSANTLGTNPSASVPEPNGFMLISIATMLLAAMRNTRRVDAAE